jgi:DNA-binding transcriptional LysR family regulator
MSNDSVPFDLRSLEVFLAVCQNETISGAARALKLTQSAVSQIISDLEQRTSTTLFDRSVRPLGLTPGGLVLRQRASALIAEARQIAPLLKQVTRGKLPVVRVGIVSSLSRLLVPALPMFMTKYADQVSLLSGFTASHMDDVGRRRLEIAVGFDEFDLLDGLESWPVLEEPYVVLLPAGTKPVTTHEHMAELANTIPFARYHSRRKMAVAIERHLRRIGLRPPHKFEFDTVYGVAASVASGNCWAIASPLLVYETLQLADLIRCCPLPGPGFTRRISLMARSRELGGIPRETSEFICGLLRDTCLPALAPHVGVVQGRMVIGHDLVRRGSVLGPSY